jgi:hypothetical protein
MRISILDGRARLIPTRTTQNPPSSPLRLVAGAGLGEGKQAVLFKKKNQKTFHNCCQRSRNAFARSAKVLASFFNKTRFLCFARRCSVPRNPPSLMKIYLKLGHVGK